MEQHEDYLEAIRRLGQSRDEQLVGAGIDVRNAGVMMILPYFPFLFNRLGLLADNCREFKNVDSSIRAIFLIQYLIYDEQREWKEPELYLNKIMVGLEEYNQPLPRALELSEEETSMTEDLLKSICHIWDKMRKTPPRVFREAFLQRKGQVMWHEDLSRWEIKVEEKAYDVLLDSLPWEFRMYKYLWQKSRFEVRWR